MRVAMLLQKSSAHDSRVQREARALADAGHVVTIAELAPGPRRPQPGPGGYETVSALLPPRLKRLAPFKLHRLISTVTLVRAAVAARPDVVHAHDVAMLPAGWLATVAARARLVYDTHEYAPGVPWRTPAFRLMVRAIERLLVRRAALVITVSDGIADRLAADHRLEGRPIVVRNLPDLPAPTGDGGLRAELGIGTAPLVLHQGAPAVHRGCEPLIAAMRELDGVQLAFLGDGEPAYVESLKRLAAAKGVSDGVHFAPSRPLESLLSATAEADVGVSLLQDVCENHRLALPNKVFEYVAAGVPVVAADLPEMRRLMGEYPVGRLVDSADPAAIAAGLRAVLAERNGAAPGLGLAARELSWEREKPRLLAAYEALGPLRH